MTILPWNAVGSNTTASEPFTLTGGYSSSENLYIEGKYNTGGNDTVFTFSSYTISSYSGNEQSITLTTAANIPANANIKIIFHDHFGDALCSNPREGRGIYYDFRLLQVIITSLINEWNSYSIYQTGR